MLKIFRKSHLQRLGVLKAIKERLKEKNRNVTVEQKRELTELLHFSFLIENPFNQK